MFSVKVGQTFEDARKSYINDLEKWNPILEKITDLFLRMQTWQAEIVATVLFAAYIVVQTKKEKPSENEVLEEVMRWKQRRRPHLEKADVAVTIRNLAALNWLKVKPSEDLPIPEEALDI
jgi:hypothetical protein